MQVALVRHVPAVSPNGELPLRFGYTVRASHNMLFCFIHARMKFWLHRRKFCCAILSQTKLAATLQVLLGRFYLEACVPFCVSSNLIDVVTMFADVCQS